MHTALAASLRIPRTLPFHGAMLALVVALHALAGAWVLRTVVGVPTAAPTLAIELLPLAPAAQTPPQKSQPTPPKPTPRPATPAAPISTPVAAPAAAAPTAVNTAPAEVAVPGPTTKAAAATPTPAAPSAPRFDADYLQNPAPSYPPLSRRLGEQGRVVLRVHVQADGLPGEIAIQAGSGSSRLDQAALETVRRWRFVPARQGDAAVAAWVQVPIAFTLKE